MLLTQANMCCTKQVFFRKKASQFESHESVKQSAQLFDEPRMMETKRQER